MSESEDMKGGPGPGLRGEEGQSGEHLYAIADRELVPEPGEPEVVFCLDEFGPLNLQPHPGRQWAECCGKHRDPDRRPRRRQRAPLGPAKAPSRRVVR